MYVRIDFATLFNWFMQGWLAIWPKRKHESATSTNVCLNIVLRPTLKLSRKLIGVAKTSLFFLTEFALKDFAQLYIAK